MSTGGGVHGVHEQGGGVDEYWRGCGDEYWRGVFMSTGGVGDEYWRGGWG